MTYRQVIVDMADHNCHPVVGCWFHSDMACTNFDFGARAYCIACLSLATATGFVIYVWEGGEGAARLFMIQLERSREEEEEERASHFSLKLSGKSFSRHHDEMRDTRGEGGIAITREGQRDFMRKGHYGYCVLHAVWEVPL